MPRQTRQQQTDNTVREAVASNPGATAKEIAETTGVPQKSVSTSLSRLESGGQVERTTPKTKPGEQYKGDTFKSK